MLVKLKYSLDYPTEDFQAPFGSDHHLSDSLHFRPPAVPCLVPVVGSDQGSLSIRPPPNCTSEVQIFRICSCVHKLPTYLLCCFGPYQDGPGLGFRWGPHQDGFGNTRSVTNKIFIERLLYVGIQV